MFTPTGNEKIDRLQKARQEMRLGKSAIDDYADKLGAKLGKKSKALGIDLPTTASKIVDGTDTEESIRQPKLGSLGTDGYEDYNEDYDNDDVSLNNEQLREQLEIETETAKEAIEMLRRNVDEHDEYEDMSEDDLMDAVSRALSESNFKTSREKLLEEEEEMKSNPLSMNVATSTALAGATGSTARLTPAKTTSGVGGSWAPPVDETDDEYKPSKSG